MADRANTTSEHQDETLAGLFLATPQFNDREAAKEQAQARRDQRNAWLALVHEYQMHKHQREVAQNQSCMLMRLGRDRSAADEQWNLAFEQAKQTICQLMAFPAPGKLDLKFKRSLFKAYAGVPGLQEFAKEWERQLAADEERLS